MDSLHMMGITVMIQLNVTQSVNTWSNFDSFTYINVKIHHSFFIVLPIWLLICRCNIFFFFTRQNLHAWKIGWVLDVLHALSSPATAFAFSSSISMKPKLHINFTDKEIFERFGYILSKNIVDGVHCRESWRAIQQVYFSGMDIFLEDLFNKFMDIFLDSISITRFLSPEKYSNLLNMDREMFEAKTRQPEFTTKNVHRISVLR